MAWKNWKRRRFVCNLSRACICCCIWVIMSILWQQYTIERAFVVGIVSVGPCRLASGLVIFLRSFCMACTDSAISTPLRVLHWVKLERYWLWGWSKLYLQRDVQMLTKEYQRLRSEMRIVCCTVVLEMSPTSNTQATCPRWTGRAFPFEGAVQLGFLVTKLWHIPSSRIWQSLSCLPLNTKQQNHLPMGKKNWQEKTPWGGKM